MKSRIDPRWDLLVGLPGLHVIDVADDGGGLTLTVEMNASSVARRRVTAGKVLGEWPSLLNGPLKGPTQVAIENGCGHPSVSAVLSLSRILSHMSSSTLDWAVVRLLPAFW